MTLQAMLSYPYRWPKPDKMREDIGLTALCVVFYFIAQPLFYKFFLRPLGYYYISRRLKKQQDATKTPKKTEEMINDILAKFLESGWKVAYYTSSVLLGTIVAAQHEFFYNSRLYWRDYANMPDPTLAIRIYYAFGLGYYIHALIDLYSGTRRKDHVVMVSHHLVTMALVIFSYAINFYRVGVVVFLVHDVCDPFLELAKMCRYAGSQKGGSIFFGLFVAAWIIFRYYFYPFVILYSLNFYALEEIPDAPIESWAVFAVLLHILLILHIYWGYLIYKVMERAYKGNELGDVREEDD